MHREDEPARDPLPEDESQGVHGERDRERDREAITGEHSHPASPNQPDSGFAEGQEDELDTEEEELEPDFARGQREEDEPDELDQRRFSEGVEEEGETLEKNVERRFSEGQDRSPTSE